LNDFDQKVTDGLYQHVKRNTSRSPYC